MRYLSLFVVFFTISFSGQAQDLAKYVEFLKESEFSSEKRLRLTSGIDSLWEKWSERGYSFGFNPGHKSVWKAGPATFRIRI